MITFGEFFWINPGPYYIIFPIYFIVYAVISLVVMIRAYSLTPKKSIARAQIRNLILGGIMGYTGGVTNFFPQVFSIYPFGNYLVIFYIVFMVYGVIKYNMLSKKVISAQIFSIAICLVSLFNFLKSNGSFDMLLNFGILILVIIFSLLLISSVNIEVKSREKIELLAKDLEFANTHLTELNRQKSEFVSFATHQLRAPLTAMKGYASLLLEGDMGVLPESAKLGVSRIYESTNTLVSIVNDYLNISRIELGAMKYIFETIDLKTLIEDVIAEVKPNIDKAGIEFSFTAENHGMDYHTTADRDKLKQVIGNVIDNSLKYTPSGSIKTTLSFNKTKHLFVFSVKDTGVGIAPETLPHLFKKFSRADNASKTNIRGTGLGLYVAKQMVEAHHGTIRAESEGEGKGSTFTIELEPFKKA
ncbi:MAG: ATP-binding protein [Candidatus Paceibacterota bacterium]|jgi:signal transduction histidine kinase